MECWLAPATEYRLLCILKSDCFPGTQCFSVDEEAEDTEEEAEKAEPDDSFSNIYRKVVVGRLWLVI